MPLDDSNDSYFAPKKGAAPKMTEALPYEREPLPVGKASVDMALMADRAEEASAIMRALGNPHRLLILCILSGGEASVGEIQEQLDLRQSLVSQHLTRLRADDLVVARRSQQFMLYSLKNDVVRDVISVLCRHYLENCRV
jgi:DNA-binding transcriptional ArsR family regulator